MADKKEKRLENTVKIEGYIRENNLEKVKNYKNEYAIRGSLIIATDKINNHKVQFYVSEYMRNGSESQDYKKLEELLPENTISIASYLKNNQDASFDVASNAATKIWVIARFEEYATRSGERESSYATIKGFKIGLASVDKQFAPKASFEVDAYINDMTKELDENNNETGRITIEGLLPRYDNSVDKISFVAGVGNGVADFISNTYNIGNTVHLFGDIVNVQERKAVATTESEYFGRPADVQYVTSFVRERRITGGTKAPLNSGDAGAISKETVKNGLAERLIKAEKNAEYAARKNSGNSYRPEQHQQPSNKIEIDDIDF